MNSIAANGDTALEAGRGRSQFKTRLVSAAALAPVVLGVIYLGSPWFDAFILLTIALMGFEWGRMAFGGLCFSSAFFFTAVSGITVCAILAPPEFAFFLLLACAVVFTIALMAAKTPNALMNGAALVAIGATGFGLIWLQALPGNGLTLLVWLLVAVWATDTGAYFAGKLIGGPKLAPGVSPGKTWAGLFGGIFLAVIWGALFAAVTGFGGALFLGILSGVLAIFAQGGDLAVSVAKRRFSVKDAGRLIPGHGGILDRADGLIGTVPVIAVIVAFYGGELPAWI